MPLVHGISEQYTAFSVATFTMDATTDFVAFRRRMLSTSPIIKFEAFIDIKTGTPGNLECVLVADNDGVPNISGGVPVDIGGGSPTLVSIANGSISSAARLTGTFTNAYTPTAGDYVWLVFYPGSGGSGWSASHRYIFRTNFQGIGADYGDENFSTSTDTGSTWTRGNTGCPWISLLTTADAYLPSFVSACPDGITNTDFDDADNPDERGCAWTIPSDTTAKVYGMHSYLRVSALTADFNIGCYLDNSSQSSRSIDASKLEVTAANNRLGTMSFDSPPITISSTGTARVALKATHASDTIRFSTVNFGTQARRESAFLFRDYWYCNQNAAGGFTDDLTRLPSVLPIVEHYGSGGGGGAGPATHGSLQGGIHQ